MGKKIQISESALHNIILEATKKVLNEMVYNNNSPEEAAIDEIVRYIQQNHPTETDLPPIWASMRCCLPTQSRCRQGLVPRFHDPVWFAYVG